MDLKGLKNLFFNFLKQFNEKEIFLLMDYLGSLIVEYENDYSKFFQLINKESSKKSNPFENLMLSIDRFQDQSTNEVDGQLRKRTVRIISGSDMNSYQENSTRQSESILNSECNSEITTNQTPVNETNSSASRLSMSTNPSAIKRERIEQAQLQNQNQIQNTIPVQEIQAQPVQLDEQTEEEQEQEQELQQTSSNKRKTRAKTRSMTRTSNNATRPVKTRSDKSRTLTDLSEIAVTTSSVKTKQCDRALRKRTVRVSSDTDLASLPPVIRRPSQNHITPSKRKPTVYREYFIKHKPKSSDQEMEMKVEDNFRYKFHVKIRSYLTKKYIENRYPNKAEMEQIAVKTKLNPKQIMMWFKDMRRKNNHTKPNKFKPEIVNILLKFYDKNKYPTEPEIEEMATQTGIRQQQVIQWFQDRRYRCRHTVARARFPKEAVEYMTKMFKQIKNPTSEQFDEMAKATKLTHNQVYTWFKINRKKAGINSKLNKRKLTK